MAPRPVYGLVLTGVERQQRGSARQELAPTSPNTFEDERIRIAWEPQTANLQFILTNKTDASERVLWDDASFVGTDGRTDRIMHQGIKYIDRSASMPPTLIIHGATLEDLVAPASNVFWQEGYASDPGSWRSRPLIPQSAASAAEVPGAKGPSGSMKILLPIEANGAVHEYLFDFAIREVAQSATGPAGTTQGGGEIKVVRKREEVEKCELLGEISAHPPYIWPGDDLKQLRRKAAPLGADTILIPGWRVGVVEGFAYRCSAR